MFDLSILNEAQKEAVTAPEGPMLVIAGAGSGKTRTIVYRLAWLAEHGMDPHSMLLLTFTRKASQEMLHRAAGLLEQQLLGVQGGTFHSFAFSVLRRWCPDWTGGTLSVMDTSDSVSAIQACKENLKIGRGDRSFPRTQAVLGLLSKARNKEMELEEVLSRHKDRDGLFCTSDILALQAMGVACKLARRIPEDLKVVGFDGTKLARTLRPSLTTVAQPTGQMARLAVESVIEAAKPSSVRVDMTVEVRLVEGDSTMASV